MSIKAIDIIDRLPLELAARLIADPYFCDVPVIVFEEGNIKLEMQRKQAVQTTKSGKRGVAVVVLQTVADDDFDNLQFGPMTLRPSFQVIENLELNRGATGTGKSARQVSRKIRDVIKSAGLIGLVKDMRADKPCITPVPLVKELGDLVKAYQVNFRCLEISSEAQSMAQMPQFSPFVNSTPQFQITCPTDGVDIWYTTDDSYPAPGTTNPEGTAKLYSDPIDIPANGVLVRACAYKEGMIASWVNRSLITATPA